MKKKKIDNINQTEAAEVHADDKKTVWFVKEMSLKDDSCNGFGLFDIVEDIEVNEDFEDYLIGNVIEREGVYPHEKIPENKAVNFVAEYVSNKCSSSDIDSNYKDKLSTFLNDHRNEITLTEDLIELVTKKEQ